MIKLLQEQHGISKEKQELIDMEELMIRRLDFDLRSEPPLTFLERYFRVFGID